MLFAFAQVLVYVVRSRRRPESIFVLVQDEIASAISGSTVSLSRGSRRMSRL